MNRFFLISISLLLPIVALAQASGGQISRPTIRVDKAEHHRNISKRAQVAKPQTDNRQNRVVLINCGVPSATIIIDDKPYNRTGHLLTFGVHQVKILAEGYEDFEQSIIVNNDYSPNYTFKLQPCLSLISKEQLSRYNVIICTFSIFANARWPCQKMRDAGYEAHIYKDSQGLYRVIAESFDDKSDALNCWALMRSKGYSDTWIMSIENGQEYRYR